MQDAQATARVELPFEREALSRVDVQRGHGDRGPSALHEQREPRPVELGEFTEENMLLTDCLLNLPLVVTSGDDTYRHGQSADKRSTGDNTSL
jgi:hypothetical protein